MKAIKYQLKSRNQSNRKNKHGECQSSVHLAGYLDYHTQNNPGRIKTSFSSNTPEGFQRLFVFKEQQTSHKQPFASRYRQPPPKNYFDDDDATEGAGGGGVFSGG